MSIQRILTPLSALAAGSLALLALSSFRDAEAARADDALHEHMEAIENSVKRLRRSLRDPEQLPASLTLVGQMQADTLACKGEKPHAPENVTGEALEEYHTAYRRMMVDFLAAQLELEAALLDGDKAKADAAFSKVRDFEETGHERFTSDG